MIQLDEMRQTVCDLKSVYPRYDYRIVDRNWLEMSCACPHGLTSTAYEMILVNQQSKFFRVRPSSTDLVADIPVSELALIEQLEMQVANIVKCESGELPLISTTLADLEEAISGLDSAARKTDTSFEFSDFDHLLTLKTDNGFWTLTCPLDLDWVPLAQCQIEALSYYLLLASEHIRLVTPVLCRKESSFKSLLEVNGFMPLDERQLRLGIGAINTFYARHVAQVRALIFGEELADLYLKKRNKTDATTRGRNIGIAGA
jgi:hypothetical protein